MRRLLAALLLLVPAQAFAQPVDPFATLPAILPAPPVSGSPAEAADIAAVLADVPPERLEQAAHDQILDPFFAFAEVLGPGFNPPAMRAVDELLYGVSVRASSVLAAAKGAYPRVRPFVGDPAVDRCYPGSQGLDANYSYPSTHAALGFAWALVLAELMPQRAEAILARGLDYGTSRVVCGLHWPSDVAAGQQLAAAIVAVLHTDPAFRAAFDAARAEAAALH